MFVCKNFPTKIIKHKLHKFIELDIQFTVRALLIIKLITL